MVVEANPINDDSTGVSQALKAAAMYSLLFECPDHPLYQSFLFRALRRNDFLLQAIALDQGAVATAGEHLSIVHS